MGNALIRAVNGISLDIASGIAKKAARLATRRDRVELGEEALAHHADADVAAA